jgi:hypothetical protein
VIDAACGRCRGFAGAGWAWIWAPGLCRGQGQQGGAPRGAPDAATAKQDRAQYASGGPAAESLAYYNLLKERFKAQIKVPKPVTEIRNEAQATAESLAAGYNRRLRWL